jgi:hypothetical protein
VVIDLEGAGEEALDVHSEPGGVEGLLDETVGAH